jgi:hypothetical protein
MFHPQWHAELTKFMNEVYVTRYLGSEKETRVHLEAKYMLSGRSANSCIVGSMTTESEHWVRDCSLCKYGARQELSCYILQRPSRTADKG